MTTKVINPKVKNSTKETVKNSTKKTIKRVSKVVSHDELLNIKESLKTKVLTDNFQNNTKFSIDTKFLGKSAKQIREAIRVDMFKIVDSFAIAKKQNKVTNELKQSTINAFKVHLFTYRKNTLIDNIDAEFMNNLFVGQSERKENYDIFKAFVISELKLK